MKKLIALILSLTLVLVLVGCKDKTIKGSELYSFPEPTIQITGSFYSQGHETAFEIGSEKYDPNDLTTIPVISWFYDLELIACDEPETVEGSEGFTFRVSGKDAFSYEDRGGGEAYIIINKEYYKVSNTSTPPVSVE